MKKLRVFPVIFLFPLLFACEFPSAIELRGTPELRISAQMDIGGMLVQLLEENLNSIDGLARCVNTSNLAYIFYKDDLIDDNPTLSLPSFTYDIKLPASISLYSGSTPSIPIDIPTDLDSLLKGFIFHNSKAYLYISGTENVIKKLSLGVSINSGQEKKIDIKGNHPSNYKTLGGEYTEQTVPSGGYLIELPLDGNDVSVGYTVYAKAGETFSSDDFDDVNIKVELVIWLPLEFIAGSDGAEIAFPLDSFLGGKDLFGRESPDAENTVANIIESLSMTIKLDTNPFLGKNLIIQNGPNIKIEEKILTNSLNIVFDEENMALINDPANFPFAPTIKIVFHNGETLKIPRVFNTTELILSAKIKVTIEF